MKSMIPLPTKCKRKTQEIDDRLSFIIVCTHNTVSVPVCVSVLTSQTALSCHASYMLAHLSLHKSSVQLLGHPLLGRERHIHRLLALQNSECLTVGQQCQVLTHLDAHCIHGCRVHVCRIFAIRVSLTPPHHRPPAHIDLARAACTLLEPLPPLGHSLDGFGQLRVLLVLRVGHDARQGLLPYRPHTTPRLKCGKHGCLVDKFPVQQPRQLDHLLGRGVGQGAWRRGGGQYNAIS
mmetsp:Transcript_12716/g.36932  ORF Transcript_12716/g.36932 Transcript_12716/m.36932 type:complete len:235 (+) Transcript_12716:1753-2457(+)